MTLTFASLLGLLLALGAPVAGIEQHPSGNQLHPDVAYALIMVPGGTATSAEHAVWPDGMEIQSPSAMKAVANCPTSRVCAFSNTATSGSMLSWSTCGVHSTAALLQVKSIANARAGGVLQARNGTSVIGSALAGTWTNVTGTVTDVRCIQ